MKDQQRWESITKCGEKMIRSKKRNNTVYSNRIRYDCKRKFGSRLLSKIIKHTVAEAPREISGPAAKILLGPLGQWCPKIKR